MGFSLQCEDFKKKVDDREFKKVYVVFALPIWEGGVGGEKNIAPLLSYINRCTTP
jgi:hypothetical protein